MATKAEVNKVLRKHGLANIKMLTGEYGKEQTYRDLNHKMVKGIRYATSGPLDCFLNITGRRKMMFEAIATDLKAIGCIVDGTWITVSQTNKKTTYLELWDTKHKHTLAVLVWILTISHTT